jgi:Zn-dependent M28 family amino/carboxypeptidase
VNPGAAKIERDFVDYFNSAGVATEPTAFDGRSDYKAFQDNGVAAGGLFSGAEVAKSEAQVAKWGGQLGVAFDHCYHQACDDITNLDLAGYDVLADGGAHVLALLAEDPDLRDSLGGGATAATAATASKKSLTAAQKRRLKARKAKMAEYLGSRLAR